MGVGEGGGKLADSYDLGAQGRWGGWKGGGRMGGEEVPEWADQDVSEIMSTNFVHRFVIIIIIIFLFFIFILYFLFFFFFFFFLLLFHYQFFLLITESYQSQ